ncbi:MAG: hypothetical protein C0626_07730 [Arcobacter sp.]|uniref:hypothetical protein n=1 Tax=uncultured Arcobacter sp. TaxID=165434 RepID=UPI000CBCB13A|nr:hypothetical protein [uncultured Arcobacter sp.]PLY09945.1 MAG: hypothetical protein C0626_07730 [Arcobacter sp.]
MYKVLFLIFVSTMILFSKPIKFKEEKYISALSTSVYRNGILKIDNDTLEIRYLNEDKSFIFTKENIIEKNGDKKKVLNYEENFELTIFSKIIDSIYKNKPENLKEYFQIIKDDSVNRLIPNDYISNVISKIEYKKKDDKLIFLKIFFTNDDWINIVEN